MSKTCVRTFVVERSERQTSETIQHPRAQNGSIGSLLTRRKSKQLWEQTWAVHAVLNESQTGTAGVHVKFETRPKWPVMLENRIATGRRHTWGLLGYGWCAFRSEQGLRGCLLCENVTRLPQYLWHFLYMFYFRKKRKKTNKLMTNSFLNWIR